MPSNLDQYRYDLKGLGLLGEEMLIDLSLRDAAVEPEQQELAQRIRGSFERKYQRWYTEAQAVVGQLIPGRAAEFEQLYMGDGRRRAMDALTFNIQDWLTGRRVSDVPGEPPPGELLLVSMRLKTQLEILRAAEARFESSLFDMRQLVRADLFDSELDACRALVAHGFFRAAGTIVGVLLEKHLRQVLEAHELVMRKAEPTLNDFNDHLKRAGVLDVPRWRHLQRLADIRNLCGHSKNREPERDEVEELIDGVDRTLRTLF